MGVKHKKIVMTFSFIFCGQHLKLPIRLYIAFWS